MKKTHTPTNQNSSDEVVKHQIGLSNKPSIIISVLLAIMIAGSIVYFWQRTKNEKVVNKLEEQISSLEMQLSTGKTKSKEIDSNSNWQVYDNTKYGFSFKYPKNYVISEHIENPGYLMEDSVSFGIALTQEIYVMSAQTPLISIQVVQTDKTINQIIDQLKNENKKIATDMTDPGHTYHLSDPPKIINTQTIQIGNFEAIKIDRRLPPGIPNTEVVAYYIQSPDYVFILSANYGTYNSEVDQDGTIEKEELSKIIETFEYTY